MSAFLVEEATIADAVECLRLHSDPWFSKEMAASIGEALWRMNALALRERYGDPVEDYEADIKAYSNPDPSDNPVQVLKSAKCLLYQCSEGNVPETEMFKVLAEAVNRMEAVLKRTSGFQACYDKAQWGRK